MPYFGMTLLPEVIGNCPSCQTKVHMNECGWHKKCEDCGIVMCRDGNSLPFVIEKDYRMEEF